MMVFLPCSSRSDTEVCLFASADCYLLHGHLGHQIKGGEVCTGKAVFVLAHLDGIQPLIHRSEAGEIRDAAVEQREMNATEDKNQDCSHQLIQTPVTPNGANAHRADGRSIIFQTSSSKTHLLE